MTTFRDHFSTGSSADYATFRPRYPAALFEALAAHSPARRVAWDCGTGTGQVATTLARDFDRVIATDASRVQIESAEPNERVEYRIAMAEASGLADRSVDIVTVGQAIHWFDRPAFYAEVRRVVTPGALCAVFGYGNITIAPEIDPIIDRLYGETVGQYWPPERVLVEQGYRTIEFPFPELALPPMAIEQAVTLDGLAGYLRTWSATQRYIRDRGVDPVADVVAELAPRWGAHGATRVARWPMHVRVGPVSA
jgi:SAM-dependent methyltransferase